MKVVKDEYIVKLPPGTEDMKILQRLVKCEDCKYQKDFICKYWSMHHPCKYGGFCAWAEPR